MSFQLNHVASPKLMPLISIYFYYIFLISQSLKNVLLLIVVFCETLTGDTIDLVVSLLRNM